MRVSLCFVAFVACAVLANVDTTTAQKPPVVAAVINECDLTPAPGSCVNRRPIEIWTFSRRTQNCQKIFGCYTFGDRNVFRNRVDCRDTCGSQSECDAIPERRYNCNGRRRKYYTFVKQLGRCERITGCYWTSDQNVFRHRRDCRKECGGRGSSRKTAGDKIGSTIDDAWDKMKGLGNKLTGK